MSRDDRKKAFVLMPFEEELNWAYSSIILPAFGSAGFEVTRANEINNQRSILKDIVVSISDADVVIADLTGSNPNVYYELGIAHALGKQVVMISQDEPHSAPFDLRSYRITQYGDRFDVYEEAKKALERTAADIMAGEIEFGNPVSDFLGDAKESEELT